MSDTLKLCKDCRHIVLAEYGFDEDRMTTASCAAFNGPIDPVSGIARKTYCGVQRAGSAFWSVVFNQCGPQGRKWEPKP